MINSEDQKKVRNGVRSAILEGLRNWQAEHPPSSAVKIEETAKKEPEPLEGGTIFGSIPRRDIKIKPIGDLSLPLVQSTAFRSSRIKALGRLFVWVFMIFSFFAGNLWDKLRRRGSEARQAVRLRRTFERVGGTFVKLGQQLAMRIDLLPWGYTVELAKMLD